ncbi:MAG: alpha/beta hydrolase [Pseudomonadota bacterium]
MHKKTILRALSLSIVTALFSACGGSSGGGNNVTATPDPQRYLERTFSNVDITPEVTYYAGDTVLNRPALTMDIYTPAGDTRTDRPVIIIAFGGGFIAGDKDSVAGIATFFAEFGYVAAAIDYRVLGRQPVNADELTVAGLRATHDLFAAVRFFRSDANTTNTWGTRANAIFVAGVSAGGVMAANAAALDLTDTFTNPVLNDFFFNNGGVFGVRDINTAEDSRPQGALSISGALLELGTVDADSAILYAAHEELDPVVPCGTAAEGSSSTGLVVSGGCVMVPAFEAANVAAELFLVPNATTHVGFNAAQQIEFQTAAATLFFNEVIRQ